MTYPQRDMHIHIFKRAHTHTHAHTYAHHIYIVGDPENLFLSFTHSLSQTRAGNLHAHHGPVSVQHSWYSSRPTGVTSPPGYIEQTCHNIRACYTPGVFLHVGHPWVILHMLAPPG